MSPAGVHLLQSVSKSITGSVAGILAGRGELDPEEQVVHYLPELAGGSFEGATVRHLLDMRTGTRFSEIYDDPASDVRIYEPVIGWCPPTGPLSGRRTRGPTSPRSRTSVSTARSSSTGRS